ncbi:glucose 1-dehydrogenase [Sphingomonas sp. CL5.1]|uniref:SDR family NAD(P)-dependent oxidoreductase n=1 Tax=Sphingomonas sp. CL5.1 TaxID=2653203 RepID=UPI001584281C|nr:glucose 1-dehydrogenase [Sphingomonas sp. CL5.1]QKS01109.1 glucose 1-dehydrogenase [Sphingomonas sp. CL5.1]
MAGIEGRSIVVTGGASGIGEAAVRLFAAHGALVTAADFNVERGTALADELDRQGLNVQFVRADISREEDVAAMVEAAERRYGRLDGAFNNAGIANAPGLLADMTFAEFQRVFGVNAFGTFLCMKYEIQAMLRVGGGAIVNTSSVSALIYDSQLAAYSASKHAITGLTRAAAAEYGERNIRVNAIAPSATRTPLYMEYVAANPDYVKTLEDKHALRRAAEPVEQARAAMWLLSDEPSFVTGVTLPVDGGYTLY